MHYEFFGKTDQGLVRQNNEDALAFDEALGCCILADGMGGYEAGEVASYMAVQSLLEWSKKCMQLGDASVSVRNLVPYLIKSLEDVSQSIFEWSRSTTAYAGMGTTVVMGVFREHELLLAHVGDSRCYRLREDALTLLTKDHSWVQEQVDAGLMEPLEAQTSPQRGILTRALGAEKQLESSTQICTVQAGDTYLFCSDGLTDMLHEEAIQSLMMSKRSLAAKAQVLINEANYAGGRDNISVLLARAYGTPARKFPMRLLRR